MELGKYITTLSSEGHYCFSTKEAQTVLGVSDIAIKSSLRRMRQKDEIASPIRGFHLIVPPEYRRLQCLPPEQFIDGLMRYLGSNYYIGLLSAAQFYGATHQRPQIFQTVIPTHRVDVTCGKVRIAFIANKLLPEMPTRDFNTPTSVVKVSSPETTAIDLVRYPQYCGGLSNVATVLIELAENIDPQTICKVIDPIIAPPVIQRLGYLFSYIGEAKIADCLEQYLMKRSIRTVVLDLHARTDIMSVDKRWKIAINSKVEPDL